MFFFLLHTEFYALAYSLQECQREQIAIKKAISDLDHVTVIFQLFWMFVFAQYSQMPIYECIYIGMAELQHY